MSDIAISKEGKERFEKMSKAFEEFWEKMKSEKGLDDLDYELYRRFFTEGVYCGVKL